MSRRAAGRRGANDVRGRLWIGSHSPAARERGVRVVLGSDAKARLAELLTITPMGPPPAEPGEPPAP